jgi:hypothetical protein
MIQEKQLGQLRPANTTAASLYSPGASTTWVAKNLVVCNTSGAGASFRAYHDEDGTTYDETTAIFWDVPVAANETVSITSLLSGFTNAGNIGVRTDTASALTFTLYGAEIT